MFETLPEAAYVHVPFCQKKCSYCDFISYPGQPAAVRQTYCTALLQEIRQTAGLLKMKSGEIVPRLSTVFVGGGTPTVLEPEQLSNILQALADGFGLDEAGEYTLEANPGTVTAASLQTCRQAGFNRISFGLQAAQPHLLRLLGRIHDRDDFVASVQIAALAGFRSINADIMFGLPGQTLADVSETIALLLQLPIDHISFYSLTLEEGTPLHQLCTSNPSLLPDEDAERAQYHLIRQSLQKAGFEHYEISNAARPGHRCRHNLTYWLGHSYYGFGAAAHNFVQGVRRANTADLKAYIEKFTATFFNQPLFPASEIMETVDEAEAKKEMLLLGLRLLEGVSFADFAARFGSDLRSCFGEVVGRLASRGLLLADEQGIRLTPGGLDLANQVFQEFV